MRTICLVVVTTLLVPAAAAAEPEPGWRFSGAIGVESLALNGIAGTIGVEPAALPRWRFSLAMTSHDLPSFQVGMSGNNDNMYVSAPIGIELGVQYTTRKNLVLGARAGVVHLHFARIGTFGIDEEFDYGVTPFVGYQWQPLEHVYVQPWLGAMVTLYRQRHGELPMAESDRTYSTWPTALRGGVLVGAIY